MSQPFYREYVTDEKFMQEYRDYQQRYTHTIRESDRMLVSLARELAGPLLAAGITPRILDVGCSTGNLLLHMKRLIPGVQLAGCDMAGTIIAECRERPELADIEFSTADALDLPWRSTFDIIMMNAVLYLFEDQQYRQALRSLGAALKPEGAFVAFDFFHAWEQELAINEKSVTHPNGLMLHVRPYSSVAAMLREAGFESETFTPFALPIDLERPADTLDMRTYTVMTAEGARLPFRGSLFQPWGFLVARKSHAHS